MKNNDSTRTTAHPENTLILSSNEQQLLAKFQELDRPTRQILLIIMRAVIDNDLSLIRTCQKTLPEKQRHSLDELIDKVVELQELPTYLMVLSDNEETELDDFIRSEVPA